MHVFWWATWQHCKVHSLRTINQIVKFTHSNWLFQLVPHACSSMTFFAIFRLFSCEKTMFLKVCNHALLFVNNLCKNMSTAVFKVDFPPTCLNKNHANFTYTQYSSIHHYIVDEWRHHAFWFVSEYMRSCGVITSDLHDKCIFISKPNTVRNVA